VSAPEAVDVPDDVVARTYREAREQMLAIAGALDASQAASPVPACPAWTVHHLLAHVTGIAADLSAGRRPDGDTQAWVDAQVEARRDHSLEQICAEWSEVGPVFEAMIDAKPQRLWGLAYDTVVHEHDLRNAVGLPGHRDASRVQTAALLGLRLVRSDLEAAGLPPVEIIIDGTVHGIGGGPGAAEFVMRGSSFEMLRLLGSRRTRDEFTAADHDGDVERFLDGLVHMELPRVSLGE